MKYEWKDYLCNFLGEKIRDYQGASIYLAPKISAASAEDTPQMIMILAFCNANNGDPNSEFVQVKNYFENHYDKFNAKELEFLPKDLQLDISDFYHLWLQKYPLVTTIMPDPDKLNFDDIITKTISIRLDALNQISYSLLKGNTLIANGTLLKGKNIIKLAGIELDKSQTYNDYFIEVGTGETKIRKNLLIEINSIIPKDVSFEEGKLSFKDISFKEENSYKIEYSKSKYFDKSYFYKNSLLNFGIATVFLASDLALFSPKQSDQPVYYSLHKFSQIFSISLSLFAAVNLINSFKTRVTENKIEQKDENAIKHNLLLKEKLESIKPLISTLVVILVRVI